MDYGSGHLDGTFQFNSKYKQEDICRELRRKTVMHYTEMEGQEARAPFPRTRRTRYPSPYASPLISPNGISSLQVIYKPTVVRLWCNMWCLNHVPRATSHTPAPCGLHSISAELIIALGNQAHNSLLSITVRVDSFTPRVCRSNSIAEPVLVSRLVVVKLPKEG